MSVISNRVIGERRSGQRGPGLVKTYTKIRRVETNDPQDGPNVALSHASTAVQYQTTYSSGNDSDPLALCISVRADEEGEGFKSWIVTEEYSTVPPGNADQLSQNPLNDPPDYSRNFDQYTTVAREAVDYYNEGAGVSAIRNTAGQILRPGIEVDDSRAVLVVEKNEATVNETMAMYYTNSVNASAWRGAGPRMVKCKAITSGALQQRGQYSYYRVRYEFHLNPLTWDLRPLNQATKYKRTSGSSTTGDFLSLKSGEDPVTIYRTGSQINGIVPADANPGVEQIYLRFRYYRELDFSVFGF